MGSLRQVSFTRGHCLLWTISRFRRVILHNRTGDYRRWRAEGQRSIVTIWKWEAYSDANSVNSFAPKPAQNLLMFHR